MERHSLNNLMVETHNQKIKEQSKDVLFMQLLRGYNTTNVSVNDRKKHSQLKQLRNIQSNFWQVIVTEYFVQIYDIFEL